LTCTLAGFRSRCMIPLSWASWIDKMEPVEKWLFRDRDDCRAVQFVHQCLGEVLGSSQLTVYRSPN
jgi:hypothetical protein